MWADDGSVGEMARYERIAAALRDSILNGQYAPGERLPPQRDLARTWKTTLLTVRQALDQLQQDGLIRVEHGVGTFVVDLDQAYDPYAVASFTEVLREHGLETETQLISVEYESAAAGALTALGVTPDEGLVTLTRLRLVGSVPVVYQHSYAPGRLRAEFADYDGTVPLYAFLRHRAGLVAGAYRESVTAVPTPGNIADILQLGAGAPILLARRTTATVQGQPFLYDEAYLPPERIAVTITRQGTRYTVDLSPLLGAPFGS
jgi:GntR family transcriptional regulator